MHILFVYIKNRIYGLRYFALLIAQNEREHFLLLVICTLCVEYITAKNYIATN